MSEDFAGQVVWITGAGSGIGRAVAERFAKEGARVALMGRRAEALAAVAAALAAPPEMAAQESLDVSDRAAVDAAAERLLSRWGRVDVLVNNAGINIQGRTLKTMQPEQWDQVIAINLTGAYNLVHAVLPRMREQGSGTIINVASVAGKSVNALAGSAYIASKHGMVGFSHSIQEEEWRNGIRACAVCPGEVATEILNLRKKKPPEEDIRRMIQPEDVAAAIACVAAMDARTTVTEMTLLPTYRRKMQPGEI